MALSESDILTDFAIRMRTAGIEYMVTGSVAGQFYGLDRSTMDTDVVIDLGPGRAIILVAALRDGWVVDAAMVGEGLARRTMFNVIAAAGGKFDLIPLSNDDFEQSKFRRRLDMDWHGTQVSVITAADLVLSKLVWARESHSATQFADVRAIMARGRFDERETYFQYWLRRLDLSGALDLATQAGHDA